MKKHLFEIICAMIILTVVLAAGHMASYNARLEKAKQNLRFELRVAGFNADFCNDMVQLAYGK